MKKRLKLLVLLCFLSLFTPQLYNYAQVMEVDNQVNTIASDNEEVNEKTQEDINLDSSDELDDQDSQIKNDDNEVNTLTTNQITKTVNVGLTPNTEYQNSIGLHKGNLQQRTSFGIMLSPNSEVSLRVVDAKNYNSNFLVSFFNDDANTELNVNLKPNGETVTIQTKDAISVPFVRDVYAQAQPVIELTTNDVNVSELATFVEGRDEQQFLDSFTSGYAFMDLQRIQFLVPFCDKQYLANNEFGSIQGLSDYYNNMLNDYDAMSGFIPGSSDVITDPCYTKYFMKANKHGAGLAYYSTDHTGYNSGSIKGYLERGWVSMHEIGHGYEYGISDELDLGDVYNNTLGHFYQQKTNNPGDSSWLYGKNRINKDTQMKTIRDQGNVDFNTFGYDQKLYVFVHLLETVGPEDLGDFNIKYRQLLTNSELKNYLHSGEDKLVLLLSYSTGYNLYDYFKGYGIVASDRTRDYLLGSELKSLVYVNDVLSQDEANNKAQQLGIINGYSLVDQETLLKNLGSLTIGKLTVNVNDQNAIGKELIIKLNNNEIERVEITKLGSHQFDGLEPGKYEVYVAGKQFEHYTSDKSVIISCDNPNQTIDLNAIDVATQAGELIELKGLGNSIFAEIEYDPNAGEIRISEKNKQPHSYFSDAYVTIQIVGSDGNIKWQKDYIGNVNYNGNEVVKFSKGDKLVITHKEKDRINFVDKLTSNYDPYTKANTMTFVLGEPYLQQEGLDSSVILDSRVENYTKVLRNYLMKTDVRNYDKYNYLRAILWNLTSTYPVEKQHDIRLAHADILNYYNYHNIEVISPINGVVSTDKKQAISGENVNISITPNPGYVVNNIKVIDKTTQTKIEATNNSFIMPDGDVSVEVEFILDPNKEYSVNVNQTSNGTINVNPSAKFGQEISIDVAPEKGYRLENLSVIDDNNNVVPITDNKFIMPHANVEINATFVLEDYNITIAPTTNGSVSVSKKVANYNDEIIITTTPDSGYKVDQVIVTPLSSLRNTNNQISVVDNKFNMPDSDVHVVVTFTPIVYNAQVDNPNVDVAFDKQLVAGNEIEINITPNYGWDVVEYQILDANGNIVPITDNKFVMPNSDITIKVVTREIIQVNVDQNNQGPSVDQQKTNSSNNNPITGIVNNALTYILILVIAIAVLCIRRPKN